MKTILAFAVLGFSSLIVSLYLRSHRHIP
jgi:hypothetical protein